MQAEILSTGDEVRAGAVADTNAAYIAENLEAQGVRITRHTCVGDELAELAAAIEEIAPRVPLAVVTGGLGPTEDDRTAAAAARVNGVALVEHPAALEQVRRFFTARNLPLSAANRKQALLPQGATCLENPLGTAPGFCLTIERCLFFFLPGVPSEMRRMLTQHVVPELTTRAATAGEFFGTRAVSTFGLPESAVGEKLAGLAGQFDGLRVGLRVKFPEIHVRLYACGADSARVGQVLQDAAAEVAARLGGRVLSLQGASMAAVVGDLLIRQHATLALAESCTGGLIAKLMTDMPGSSRYFLAAGVTYANQAKQRLLGVSGDTLTRVGAVHEDTACEMAAGARRVAQADYALATTGIAGPDGGTPEKPVGTVVIGLATPHATEAFRYVFPFGRRDLNREVFAVTALDRLRRHLTAQDAEKSAAR